MSTSDARTEYLLKKANSLPTTPGVYLMKDKNGKVIYVGKSRVLRQRVSQYFQDSVHHPKTKKMVSCHRGMKKLVTEIVIKSLHR